MDQQPVMSAEMAALLRAPFPEQAIGKLPKPYKKDSPRGDCSVCGGWHGLPAVHLDYVGHAAATDRLIAVDPWWSWEPFALDAAGLPALDRDGNLWIRLTIGGVTRPGVGDGASMKERIGDAIRNAAMRFGVALDLWAKEDLHRDEPVQATPDEQAAGELFNRLRDTTPEQQEALRALATQHERKLSADALVDPGWRAEVAALLEPGALGQAMADALEGGA